MSELKPCPFCGASFQEHSTIGNAMIVYHANWCWLYHNTLIHLSNEGDIRKWNARELTTVNNEPQ